VSARKRAAAAAKPSSAPAAKTFDVGAFMRTYDAIDAQLVAAGFPATSAWWREQVEAFLRSGEGRWILRVGRRGGKSTTLSRLGVVWALAGPWDVPPGDVATVALLSVDREEASRRLGTIADVLNALGVGFTRSGETLELASRAGRRVVFRVETRSKNAVGFTSIMVLADECSRWESRDDKADPASEVIGSVAPTLAGMAHCFMVLASSPWSEVDYHAKAFDEASNAPGTGKGFASFAPTWIARPSLTEDETHTLEPDDRAWAREYAAIPGTAISGAFDARDVNRAFETGETIGYAIEGGQLVPAETLLCLDASSMRPGSDTFAIGVVHVLAHGERTGYHVAEIHAVPEGATFAGALQCVADLAREIGAKRVIFDQHQDAGLEAVLPNLGLVAHRIAMSAKNKPQAIVTLRKLMRADEIAFPGVLGHRSGHPGEPAPGRERLRFELLTLKSRLFADGSERVHTNGIDFAAAVITLAAAIDAGYVAGGTSGLPDMGAPGACSTAMLAAAIYSPDEAYRDAAAAPVRAPREPGVVRWLTPEEEEAERYAVTMREIWAGWFRE
jgi:hypothetical protein